MSQACDPRLTMVLVLGMHRSGTSAVAGMLSMLGVDFSENLIPPAEDNPKGFFEHADLWQLDQHLLEALDSDWDDPAALPASWDQTPASDELRSKAGEVLARDFAGAPVNGIKDPRMCRLMPLWRPLLSGQGFDTRVVLALRHPAEVIASLVRRDQLNPEHAAWVWLRHTLESERDTRGLPRAVIDYSQVLDDWRAQAQSIAQALDLHWPRPADEAAGDVDAFLESSLRHHRRQSALNLPEPLHGWVERVYAALHHAEGVHTDELDAVRAEMGALDQRTSGMAATMHRLRSRIRKLDADARYHLGQVHELQAGNTYLLQQRDQLKQGNTYLKQQQGELQQGNAYLRKELDAHIEALQEAQAGLRYLEGEVASKALALDDLQSQLASVAAERDEVTGYKDHLEATLEAVYTSRSWRVTRPMRGAVRLLKHLRAGSSPSTQITSTGLEPAAEPVSRAELSWDQALQRTEQAFADATGPRILIVTPDIQGPIRNGGIGTAFKALAQTLAEAGHAVTILYTLGDHCEGTEGVEHWVYRYACEGIRFQPIRLEEGQPHLDAPHHCWRAYRVYLWLREHQQQFDLAYFPEWKGEAYYALQSKRLGLDFADLRMMVVTHSSTTWAESGNFLVPEKFDDLVLEYMERRSTEMADAVISPSQYMIDWTRQRGWQLPDQVHVIQNLMPDGLEAPAESVSAPITEWVFFGRLERRKGLFIFLDALKRVPADRRQRIRVTFLGKAIQSEQFDSLAAIGERLHDWPHPPRIIADHDRDQALAYLQQPGRVAIIASLVENSPYTVLECVLKRIPFIAADVGGIAELIHADDRERAMFKPTPASLAQTLLAVEGHRYAPPRPAMPAAQTRDQWLGLQQQLLDQVPALAIDPLGPEQGPHITVCLVHYERPDMLAQAVDSLRRQTYRHFDVVLVDDGSTSQAAVAYLDSLTMEFGWRGWRIVRQANAYLGAARNTAVRHARGEYVLFMDDDNIAKPHELATFARAAQHSGADILTTVSDVFSDADRPVPPTESRQLWIPLGNATGLGVFRNVFGDANALVRRSVFQALGGFTEDYGIGHEDWEFFARACLAGHSLYLVPEPLFWYRVNADSMLRAGQADTNYARSVRPYWEAPDNGVGAALALASHMQRRPPVVAGPHDVAPPPRPALSRRLFIAVTAPLRPDVRRRFVDILNKEGPRALISRGLRYIGLRRGH
ncbi:glycosyltransferase [Oleiagrimonas sp. C23AA]|uniref:glycosyltransferase n=1 Tax=Oleiagrimonas sp. C23AA TaxID=2719047 RepID=UPI00142151F7|nr:glycosyltransferase [Oleiagrimonas sp. C23AA]NII12387.1 glycosyltransferase [Oleiagrimonas sp. C23AA]